MVGRFGRWLRAHPQLADELRGGPTELVLTDAGCVVLRTADEPDHTVSVRGFDLRGPESVDPLVALRPEPADTTIALVPDAGAVNWAEIGDGRGATSWADFAGRHPAAREFAVREGLVFPDTLPPLSGDDYPAARDGLHGLVEVLGAARQALTGRFGLRGRAGGVTTPGFPEDAWLQAAIVLEPGPPRLVVLPAPEDSGVPLKGMSPREVAATLVTAFGERGVALNLDPGRFANDPAPDAPSGFGTFLSFGANALAQARYEAGPDASSIQLWPEHFDQSFDSRRVTCGIGPGDESDQEPYLYVLSDRPMGVLPEAAEWRTEPWKGAALHWHDLLEAAATGDEALSLARSFYSVGLASRR